MGYRYVVAGLNKGVTDLEREKVERQEGRQREQGEWKGEPKTIETESERISKNGRVRVNVKVTVCLVFWALPNHTPTADMPTMGAGTRLDNSPHKVPTYIVVLSY